MNPLDGLRASVGQWQGTNALWLAEDGPADESPSTAEVTVTGDRAVAIAQVWREGGKARAGSFVVGYDAATGVATITWVDPFHTGGRPMAFTGVARTDGTLDVRGSYAAPPGPDWGWRIEVSTPARSLAIVMYNITPDGAEALAVGAAYARA